MIRPLRKLHRLVIILLAFMLIVLFVASLAVRKPIPANPNFPTTFLQAPAGGQR